MQNFIMKFRQFMYGRYGHDTLNTFLVVVSLIISILHRLFLRGIVVKLILWALLGIFIFRSLSKNISQRSKENEIFLKYYNKVKPHLQKVKPYLKKIKPLWKKIVSWFKLQQKKYRDRKLFRYIKCPYCKASIRVPFVKGAHSLYCPRCNEKIQTNIRL